MLNGAVLKFEPNNDYIKACLEEFLTNIDNRRWGANGPELLTRVYLTTPESWDLETVQCQYFQYFSYTNIGRDCLEDMRDYKLRQRMNGIREHSYVVHTNNHMGGKIVDGSVCYCLRNTFCLSTECKTMEHCKPLLETPEKLPINTGVDYIDGLHTTNMLSVPLAEYGRRQQAPNNEPSMKIYVYNQTAHGSSSMQFSATDLALVNLFETFPGRTYAAEEADIFVVPSPCVVEIAMSSCCPDATPDINGNCPSAEIGNPTNLDMLLPFYKDYREKHLFQIPEYTSVCSAGIRLFKNSLTLSVGPAQVAGGDNNIIVPTFNPHSALQPSAVMRRSLEWWTRPRKYSLTALDISVDMFDEFILSHKFIEHVRGQKTVGNLPFALLEPKEVDNAEELNFFENSIFCPCFFDGVDPSPLHRYFDAVLSGCIPVIPRPMKYFSLMRILPSRTNYSEVVLELDVVQPSNAGWVVQAMSDAIKDNADLQRRQARLRDLALEFSYGIGPDAHSYNDAFRQILGSLKEHIGMNPTVSMG